VRIHGNVWLKFFDANEVPVLATGPDAALVGGGMSFPNAPDEWPFSVTSYDRSPGSNNKIPHEVSLQEESDWGSGKLVVLMYGKITYTDAVSKKEHWVQFCANALASRKKVLPRKIGDVCNAYYEIDSN
jgi:hypothetical protein